MRKFFFLFFTSTIFISTIKAQLPDYVPADGLISWWGFNGDALDESGNGHHGTVSGPILVDDRRGDPEQAYSFDGIDDNILIADSFAYLVNTFTISGWINATTPYFDYQTIFSYYFRLSPGVFQGYWMGILNNRANLFLSDGVSFAMDITGTDSIVDNQWHMITATYNTLHEGSIYVDGVLQNIQQFSVSFALARAEIGNSFLNEKYTGALDDIGIWNRALSSQEIMDLYESCETSFITQPENQLISVGSDAHFNAVSGDPSATYQWQTDFGLGFQDVLDVNQYAGASTSELTVFNVALSNQLQPFRLLSSTSNCADTSEIALISLTDTCIVTVHDTNYVIINDTTFITITDTNHIDVIDTTIIVVNDTNFITIVDTTYFVITDTNLIAVTDTLIINVVISSLPPGIINTINVYPNPASTHLIIDYGDFALMNGYTIRIDNAIGLNVYSEAIIQQQVEIDLSSWSGKGLYFLNIIDPEGHFVEVRKIVLQ